MLLKDKVIDFLGDSITEGVGVSGLENRYDNVMLKDCALKSVHNYGIGGSRLAHQSVPSEKPRFDLCFCGRVYDINPDADIIVVYGGVNDFYHGDALIGKNSDRMPATFYGAVHFLMNFLKSDYKDKTIVFMTPAKLYHNHNLSDTGVSRAPVKRSDALPLLAYVNIIKEVAEEYAIPVLDLYHTLDINPNDPKDFEDYTVDGLHFNNAGHKKLAQCLSEFLQKL